MNWDCGVRIADRGMKSTFVFGTAGAATMELIRRIGSASRQDAQTGGRVRVARIGNEIIYSNLKS